MSKEIWKDIEGYEGMYQVSNKGRVKSIKRTVKVEGHPQYDHTTIPGKILSPQTNTNGYYHVCLFKNNKRKYKRISRLVAEHFIPNPENKPEVNHINGIKTDNYADNLEWVTCRENINHAHKNGLTNPAKGKDLPQTKLTKNDVLQIRSIYDQGLVTQKEIRDAWELSASNVHKIVHRKSWRWV